MKPKFRPATILPERLVVAKFYYGGENPVGHAVTCVDPLRVLCRPGVGMEAWASLGPAPFAELTCLKCRVLISYGAKALIGAKTCQS